MLKIDPKPLSDVNKSTESCGIHDACRSRLFRAYDQGAAGQKNKRKKEEEDRKLGAPYVG